MRILALTLLVRQCLLRRHCALAGAVPLRKYRSKMSWLHEIDNFLEEYTSIYAEHPDVDICKELKVSGNDFHEMIDDFGRIYNVDMSGYLWYFHTDEEGLNLGGIFFKPPYLRVKRIPVTPRMLAEFIEIKEWNVAYPDHQLPGIRYDLIISKIILCGIGGLIIAILYLKYIH